MKKNLLITLILIPLSLVGCVNQSMDPALYPFKDRVILVGDKVKDYLEGNVDLKIYKNETIEDDKQPLMKVNFLDKDVESYSLDINKDFSSMMNISSFGNELNVTNLMTNTTYYTKTTYKDGTIEEGSFVTQYCAPRYMNVDGIYNVRDVGGWKTNNGFIEQGILFRGSEMNKNYNITQEGIDVMKNMMKIKFDLDLRSDAEADYIEKSPLGDDVEYLRINNIQAYQGSTGSSQKTYYKKVFKSMADSSNYPMYLHCYQGADRTGTVISILLGLLGVSSEDILLDYNLTTFSGGNSAYRNGTTGEKGYKFIMSNIEMSHKGNTYAESVEKYMIDWLGLTKEEVTSIKDIFLGKTKVNKADFAYFVK